MSWMFWLYSNKLGDVSLKKLKVIPNPTFDEFLLVLLGFGQFQPTQFTYVLVSELRVF